MRTAVALAIAPARWATEVSTEITRSSNAHDSRGVGEILKLLAELADAVSAQQRGLAVADVFLQADEIDPRHRQNGRKLLKRQ